MAVPGFPARKRLAWLTLLDMPVGLTPPPAPGTATGCQIHLGEPGLRHPGPYDGGTEPGWVVLLAVTNPGHRPVRARDFTIPLAFTFPGRRIHATRITREPSCRTPRSRARIPAVPAPAARGPGPPRASRLQLAGDFVLRPDDSYAIFLLLSGTPAAGTLPIWQEGTLPGGTIVPALGPAAC